MAALSIRNIPKELYSLLKEQAEKDQRSVNQEVIWLLQTSLMGKGNDGEVWSSIDRRRSEMSGRNLSDSTNFVREDRQR